jgi:P27 family predicted phage terminase small subunit
MRGRKPKPTHLKLVDGNAGRRPINDQEPVAKAPVPSTAPHWMTESQKELYEWAIATAPEGLLKDLDGPLLYKWVCHQDLFIQAQKTIAKYGTYVTIGKQQAVQNPAIGMANTQSKHARACEIEMGWSPSSRSRVKIDPGRGQKKNPFSRLKTFGEDDD